MLSRTQHDALADLAKAVASASTPQAHTHAANQFRLLLVDIASEIDFDETTLLLTDYDASQLDADDCQRFIDALAAYPE